MVRDLVHVTPSNTGGLSVCIPWHCAFVHVLLHVRPRDTVETSKEEGGIISLGGPLLLQKLNFGNIVLPYNVNPEEVVYSGKWCSTRDVMDYTKP